MEKRKAILDEVVTYYQKSPDFNGLPIYNMKNYDYAVLSKLIDEGLIMVLSSNEVANPHIKIMNLNISTEIQKRNISSSSSYSVLYPTAKALEETDVNMEKPYTAMLEKGHAQLEIIFFNIEILERYANNPQFSIVDYGYRGSIRLKDEQNGDDSLEYEYIKDYGMAYSDRPELVRAIGVFIRDLSKLSSKKQMLWKAFEISAKAKCKIHANFYKNLILGEWVSDYWIFHALLDEMKVINKQCEEMGIPKLFIKTFDPDPLNTPDGYRNIFLPTLKNYYDFVIVLEKMIVHNISYKTFQIDSFRIKAVERKDESGKDKGSLQMFEEWLRKNIRTKEDLRELIIVPLKDIRSTRQKPAHEFSKNDYDISLHQKQLDLMHNTYAAIRAIRIFFSNHPYARDVEVSEVLRTGNGIVDY